MKELVKLGVDLYVGRVQNYSKSEANDVLRKAFLELMGTDKPDAKAFRRHKVEIFEILEETLTVLITEGFVGNNFFERFVEIRDLNLGDKNSFVVERPSILSVAKIANGTWDLRRQSLGENAEFSITTSTYGISVGMDFLTFLAGRQDWNKLIAKISEAVENKIQGEIYTSFIGGMAYLPTEFKHTGSFSSTVMDGIIQHVQAANGGADVIIVGTKKAINSMTGVADITWSDAMKVEKNANGILRTWNGNAVVELKQIHTAGTFSFAIDDTKLLVLPGNTQPVKLVKEGTPLIREVSDGTTNLDMSMDYSFIFQYGVGVIFDRYIGSYTISA